MKKIAFLSLLSATILFSFPSCDSPREEANENAERRADDVEDAADDVDNERLEDSADAAGDAADSKE